MHERIRALDDAEATRILATVAGAYEMEATGGPDDVSEALPALQSAFQLDTAPLDAVSDGDLARAALLVYASDSAHREGLRALLDSPESPGRYAVGTGMAITAAVLVVLQTYLRFERTEEGRWTVLIEKKATDSSEVLAPLVRKLMGYLKGG